MTDTPSVRSDVRVFLDRLNAMPGPRVHELDAPAARAMYVAAKSVADLPQGDLAMIADLTIPGPAGSIPVVAVDYRLAPEHRWPAASDDCEAAARWIASNPPELPRTATSLVLCGDSAGSTLTITTAMALRDTPAGVPVIVRAPIYPAADACGAYQSFEQFADGYLLTRASMAWFDDCYRADVEHMRGSPLRGDMVGLPPAVVITAGLDPIRDQGRAYASALIAAGVPVTYREAVGTTHGFITLRQAIPSAVGDVAGYLIALRAAITEAEAARVMAQAASA